MRLHFIHSYEQYPYKKENKNHINEHTHTHAHTQQDGQYGIRLPTHHIIGLAFGSVAISVQSER